MKFNLHLTEGRTEAEARARLEAIQSGPEGVAVMTTKMRHYCLKLDRVPAAAARLLKKEILVLGGEAAISEEAYEDRGEFTDVILMGTVSQLQTLSQRISTAPDGLSQLAGDLPAFIKDLERRRFVVQTPAGRMVLGERPLLMGIVNCTPDSFYDGGRYPTCEAAVDRGLELAAAGADIIDVGGESTRPGAESVEADEEALRVVPVIERLARETKAFISVDTQKAAVARRAVAAGASIINDVSSLADPDMANVAAETGAALVLMHMKGTPRTMQQAPTYHDLMGEVIAYLRQRTDQAVRAGVPRDRIIIDPGIGFGKTVAHNLELIRDLSRLGSLGRPILLGPSNKSFIGKVLSAEPDQRGPGTAVSLAIGVINGAHILRVHDVAAMKPVVDLAHAITLGEKWDRP